MTIIGQTKQGVMFREPCESALATHPSDEVTECHRNQSFSREQLMSRNQSFARRASAIKASAISVGKAVDASVHTSVQLAKRGAHKTAKVTKVRIKRGVHAGRSICLRHPRAFSVLYGVLLPLWLIIFISLGFGFFLSLIEAPNEVRTNDSYLAAREEIKVISWLATNYTRSLPSLCFNEYMRIKENLTLDTDANIQTQITNAFQAGDTLSSNETDVLNGVEITSADIKSFMARCGKIASPTGQRFLQGALNISRELDGDLTFNWMRCYDGASGVSSRTVKIGKQRRVAHRIEEVRYDAQQAFYEQKWQKDRQSIFDELVQEYVTKDNLSLDKARSKALREAPLRASAGDACGFNSAASAFFFFTIMTTVGYGNQSPSTVIGRSLIFSFGFISILLFGLILAQAGRVVSAIFDDFLGRVHPAFITKPWVSLLFWTGAYWGWMVFQAEIYMRWKEGRLGEKFEFDDAFWFSFLTSTTVGLGDFYVEPEVIIISDLLWIPAIILVGFLFFAAFLTKMIDAINMIHPRGEKKSLIDEMLDQLISQDNPEGEPTFVLDDQNDDNTNSPNATDVESAERNRSAADLHVRNRSISNWRKCVSFNR